MIVGRVHFAHIIEHLAEAQKTLNREINPTVYSTREFRSKVEENFLRTVLARKKLFLIRDESELRELGKE